MSVLARNRTQAWSEFEMNCSRLVEYTFTQTNKIPLRYQKFIKPAMCGIVTASYSEAILANEANARTPEGLAERVKFLDSSIKHLSRMQKPLAIYWSLFNTKDTTMAEWTKLINKEIVLLNGAAGYKEGDREIPVIHTYQMNKDDIPKFVDHMRLLHRFIYGKICAAPLEYKDHLSDQILQFADGALYHILEGNRILPRNKKQYEERTKHFKKAIDDLNAMQRPVLALWNVMSYSENTMDEWAWRLNDVLKLLQGVIKSDKTRFAKLQ